MDSEPSRSEQVVEHYKKHKLVISALRKIQSLILGYEEDREIDARIASIGLVLILMLVAIVVYFFLSTDSITIA